MPRALLVRPCIVWRSGSRSYLVPATSTQIRLDCRERHGALAALVRLGGARRNIANTRGSGSAVRTKREADGGMRAVAVVESKGKVGKEAVNVVEMQR